LTILIAVVMAQWVVLLGMALLIVGTYHEINRVEKDLRSLPYQPAASRLVNGDPITINLGRPLAPKTFLLALSYGCVGCVELSDRLAKLRHLRGWSLVILMKGRPPQISSIPGGGSFRLPAFAEVLHQGSVDWFRDLGITATPTAMAVVGNRLVDQEVGPRVEWFTEIEERRRAKAGGLVVRTEGVLR